MPTPPLPYRTFPDTGSTSSEPTCHHTCIRCQARRVLARTSRRSLLLGSAAAAFLIMNIASAAVAFYSLRLTQKMVATVTALDGGHGGHASQTVQKKGEHGSHGAPKGSTRSASTPPSPPTPPMPPQAQPPVEAASASMPGWLDVSAPIPVACARQGHMTARHKPAPGIVRVTPGDYAVDRAAAEEIREGAPLGGAWFTPATRGGKVTGVTLYGIRQDSTLAALGLENGDVLQSINGWDITSPESALEAYAHMSSSQDIVASLERHGASVTLRYHIR